MKNKKESPLGTRIPKRATFLGNAQNYKILNHQGSDAMLAEKSVESNPVSITFLHENTPAVLSTEVAQRFQKKHKELLRDIDKICSQLPEIFSKRNFALSFREVETGNGTVRKFPIYLLTRDAFSLLVMGFTGSAAIRWKLAYIEAFNTLETAVLEDRAALAHSHGYQQGLSEARALPASEAERKAAYLDGMKEGQRVQKRKDGLGTLERALAYLSKGVNMADTARLVDVPASTLRERVQRLRRGVLEATV